MKIEKGGEFLVKEVEHGDIFIPEEFNEEQLMIAKTCEDFVATEIIPILDRIDSMEEGLMRSLLGKAGELGILGIAVPEEYGGFGQSFITLMRANEAVGASYSYGVAFMAHTGIGSLPILCYGNHEQKQQYISKLATGEYAGCFCLTEPGAGSDANAGKTKATLSADGKHYILNGQKMWITNAGFAEVETVFAKIDNDRVLSAFIVEKAWDGVLLNPEEKKMGIKGSSTRQIFYNDVKVPIENLLGKRGEGFRIALGILHIGRIKLGVITVGQAKTIITQTVNYANERKQFGMLISNFGAIKYKLAEQVIRTFAAESAAYRSSMDIDNHIHVLIANGAAKEKSKVLGCEDFAAECALMKVYGSETLDYVVDEGVQVLGGMGYSAEMPLERGYRDSRINRIFEGTNEINRLLITETIIKSAMKKVINLFEKADQIGQEIDSLSSEIKAGTGYYDEKKIYIKNFKKAVLLLVDAVNKKYAKQLLFEQEIQMNLADMIMQVYVAESTVLRVEKMEAIKVSKPIEIYKDIVDVFVYDSAAIINKAGIDAINSFAEGEDLAKFTKALNILTQTKGVNVKEARRRVANKLIEENRYNF